MEIRTRYASMIDMIKTKGFMHPIYAAGVTAKHTEDDIFFAFRSLRRHINYDLRVELIKSTDDTYWIVCEEKDRDAVQFGILKDNENKIWQFCTNW